MSISYSLWYNVFKKHCHTKAFEVQNDPTRSASLINLFELGRIVHFGPSGGSRTHGLMDPNHARYQLRYTRKQLIYYKRNFIRCQDIRQKNLAQKIKEFFGIQKETLLKGCSLRDFTPWKNIGIVWSDPAMPIFLSLGAVRLLQ